ncbi:transposase [uncultured Defluviicoccus sp.]|uniref:Transposase n=1 Tax=metagenome TaxID=256318 RepID=A0A380TII6_9ZZZZ|nr:transposase [uncultured Defluviicoccus sp.]
MSYRHGEVLGRVERRRRFSLAQKLAVVAEAAAPGAVISAVARRHGLLPGQVFKWRRLAALGVIDIPGASELPSFVAVEVAEDAAANEAAEPVAAGSVRGAPAAGMPALIPPATPGQGRSGVIEIELGAGRCVRVVGDFDAEALRRVLDVLDRR